MKRRNGINYNTFTFTKPKHTDDTISITSLNLSEKCSTCGLPVTIMERNTCFDPKCGLK
jgi:hypothetical protein